MEDLFLNVKEHKIIRKYQKRLESSYGVKIYIPGEKSATDSDISFVSIYGNDDSIKKVQEFLQKKIIKPARSHERQEKNDILLVTLSDSDEEDESNESPFSGEDDADVYKTLCVSNCVESSFQTTKVTDCSLQLDDSVLESTVMSVRDDANVFNYNASSSETTKTTESSFQVDDSVCILESTRLSGEDDAGVSNCVQSSFDTTKTTEKSLQIDDSVYFMESTVNSGDDTSVSNCVGSSFETMPAIKNMSKINDSIYIIGSSVNSLQASQNNSPVYSYKSLDDTFQSLDESVCIIDCFSPPKSLLRKRKKSQKEKKSQETFTISSSTDQDSDICEVSSTTEQASKKLKLSKENASCKQKSGAVEIVLNRQLKKKPTPDFIPLNDEKGAAASTTENTDINIVLQSEKEKLPRHLRPIVIDGSNVAREHGRATTTFSSKGVQICVDYFLQRGHSQITVFIPKFRKHGDKRKFCPTTDKEILEELEKKQYVVYTPSRNIAGKYVSSYDDRFMVQLAAKTGGVIVSNDNFNDLINESPTYKEAIEKRLLMYCFVGDMFMIPEDPLGKNGPNLTDYLSFPPAEEPEK